MCADPQDIPHQVLAVRVGGDDYLPGLIDACPVQAGAYGCAFAQVDGVGDNGCPGEREFGEDRRVFAAGSVVNHEHLDALAVGGELVC